MQKSTLGILIILLLSSCGVSHKSRVPILIQGEMSVDKKVELAKNIVDKVWNGDFKDVIRSEIPELRSEDLNKMVGIKWSRTDFKSYTGKANPDSKVEVVCMSVFKSAEVASKITDICKSKVEEMLAVNAS